jgi:nicotinamide phosphoribosyltransferase
MTVRSTHPKFAWLPNKLETVMSNSLWLPTTSATTALRYRKVFEKFAKQTGADQAFITWQGHDFSMRGMEGTWAAAASGAGHLLSFHGTDTIPAILFLKQFYGADYKTSLVGGSVSATEHFVTCAGSAIKGEKEYLKWLITEVKPAGIISLVSDTWDLWKVLTEYLPALKDIIMAREGKVVIRPDSGNPVDILCGDMDAPIGSPARQGVIRLLYKVFGGKTNAAGYIELDPHIGAIYGDSISPERQYDILYNLKAMGFASSNIVLGIGSYTYQHVTRDTDGWAMKGTYVEIDNKPYNLSKSPVTDSGSKKSASGLLKVESVANGGFVVRENCSWLEEDQGELKTVFEGGDAVGFQTYDEICARVAANF